MKKFYLSTPIYYANDKPHIGTVYTSIAADILARWHRQKGEKVYFQTGVDEHGAKMAKAAQMAGFDSPKAFCDHQVVFFQRVLRQLDITEDYFIRTTDPNHERFVQQFLTELKNKGEIYKGTYRGLYCLGCEEFKDPSELVNGLCPLHQSKPEELTEENYFFRLSHYQEKLLRLIESDKMLIEPKERRNEILSFLKKQKLKDISISREKVIWGIPLPWDRKQTVYCWVDALLNYLSGGLEFWPCDLHLIGKDILKFHTVLWPALLLANGYPPPKRVFAHGFFTLEGKKISKTYGNIIYAEEAIQRYGSDVLRFYLFRTIPFGQDGDFSEESLKARYNADLANGLGNLVQRVSHLVVKEYQGRLSQIKTSPSLREFELPKIRKQYQQALDELRFDQALDLVFGLVEKANQYIEKYRVWQKDQNQPRHLANLVQLLKEVGERLAIFMPQTATKMEKQFQGPKIPPPTPLFPRR